MLQLAFRAARSFRANKTILSLPKRRDLSRALSAQATPTTEERRRYWQEVFAEGQDSFTLDDANPSLVSEWEAFLADREPHARDSKERVNVFVPLCGRSLDLVYLAQNEKPPLTTVFGLELASAAVTAFGEENGGLKPLHASPKFQSFQSIAYPNLRLITADFFEFPMASFHQTFHFIWDRGGVTSIPKEHRERYLATLKDLLVPSKPYSRLVVEFLDCNLDLDGSLSTDETVRLLETAGGKRFDVKKTKEEDVRAAYPQFNPPGLKHLKEVVLRASFPSSSSSSPQ